MNDEPRDPLLRALDEAMTTIASASVLRTAELNARQHDRTPPPLPPTAALDKPDREPDRELDPDFEIHRDVDHDPRDPKPPYVEYQVKGGRLRTVTWTLAAGYERTWINRLDDSGGPGLIAHQDPLGGWQLRICNCFEGTGALDLASLRINGTTRYGVTLLPGYGPIVTVEAAARPYAPGGGTAEGAENAARWPTDTRLAGTGGFGFFIAGPARANEGGGAGIYDNIQWAAGTTEGFGQARDLQRGWSNRNAYWRADDEAWARGELKPWVPPIDSLGVDRSRNLAPEGFQLDDTKGAPRLWVATEGRWYDQLDHEHLGRAVHVAAHVAEHGWEDAAVHLLFLAGDVRASWTSPNRADANPKPDTSGHLSVKGILEVYPEGQGCYWTGRAYGHALWCLAKQVAAQPSSEYGVSLGALVRLGLHVFDVEKGAILAIPPVCPAFGHKVNAYDTKLAQYDEMIPEGKVSRLEVQFESWIILLAMEAAANALELAGHHTTAQSAQSMARVMRSHLQSFRSHLRTLDNFAWSDPDGPNWFAWLTGQRTEAKIRDERMRVSWMADNAANALPQADF